MDVSTEIDNIRDNISKLNEKLYVERNDIRKIKKTSDKVTYYEKKQLQLCSNVDVGKKNKLLAGEITLDEFNGEHNMTEEQLEEDMKEREKIEYNKDWSRLPKVLKQNVIKTYINEIEHLSEINKQKLTAELLKLLKNGKLITACVKYDKTQGKLENIKKLKINEENNSYELSI